MEVSVPTFAAGLIGAMEDDTWAHASPLNRVITASRIEIHLSIKRLIKHKFDALDLSRVSFPLGEKLYFEGNEDDGKASKLTPKTYAIKTNPLRCGIDVRRLDPSPCW
jgi:hypothetical protein